MTVGSVLFIKGSGGRHSSLWDGESRGSSSQAVPALSSLSNEPAALLEILGEPVLHRVIEVLRRANVAPIFVVADQELRDSSALRSLRGERIEVLTGPEETLPALVERTVKRCDSCGIENVLLMDPSTYAEIDVESMVLAHLQGHHLVTVAHDDSGSLPIAMVTASHPEEASVLIQGRMLHPHPMARFHHGAYVNRLSSAADLRRLAQDGLQHRCRIRPNGEEIMPGTWVADSAYIHPTARLAGPVYVGPRSRVRSGAVIAECSSIERDCIVERGTTVNNSSLLSGTYVGVCLDVSSGVVNQHKFVDLRRNVVLEIIDSLLGASARPAGALMPSLWASMTRKSAPSFGGLRGRFGNLVAPRPAVPAVAQARIAYAPADTWATLKSLSRGDSSGI
jgi:NDP-sugar pyrophosphorylase family protein